MTDQAPQLTYVICTTPRSGSTLLSSSLRLTKLGGTPREFFDDAQVPVYEKEFGVRNTSIESYRDQLMTTTQSANGVFGAKVFFWHWEDSIQPKLSSIVEYSLLSPQERFQKFFRQPKLIWLERRDKLAQAISLHKATQTGEWNHNINRQPASPDVPRRTAEYDYKKIKNYVVWLSKQDMHWMAFFHQVNWSPLHIVYEEVENNVEPTVRAVMNYIGAPLPDDHVQPPAFTKKQRDSTNDEWRARFLEDCTHDPHPITSEMDWLRTQVLSLTRNTYSELSAKPLTHKYDPTLIDAFRVSYRAIIPLKARIQVGQLWKRLRSQHPSANASADAPETASESR